MPDSSSPSTPKLIPFFWSHFEPIMPLTLFDTYLSATEQLPGSCANRTATWRRPRGKQEAKSPFAFPSVCLSGRKCGVLGETSPMGGPQDSLIRISWRGR